MIRRVDAFAYANNTERSVALLSSKGLSIRTDDKANLIITPRACFHDAIIGVRDSLLDIEPMQIDLRRHSALNARWPDKTRHPGN